MSQGHPRLHSEFQARKATAVRPCLWQGRGLVMGVGEGREYLLNFLCLQTDLSVKGGHTFCSFL